MNEGFAPTFWDFLNDSLRVGAPFEVNFKSPDTFNLLNKETRTPQFGYEVPDWSAMPVNTLLATDHELEAEKIESIKQKQSRGFKVIDIDPNSLTYSESTCVYDDQFITSLLGTTYNGFDNGSSSFRVDQATTTPGTPMAYWRTLQLDLPGNFLRIEFLPARSLLNRPYTTPQVNANFDLPESLVLQNTSQLDANGYGTFVTDSGSKKFCLVDFEAPTQTPHIVQDGTTFNTYFSTILLTFKQMNTRIRIIVGYNSEMRRETKKENSLSMYGGYGLFNQPDQSPIPFEITQKDVADDPGAYNAGGIPWDTTNIYYWPLVTNPRLTLLSGYRRGLGILYLTQFSANLEGTFLGTDNARVSAIAELVKMTTTDSGLTVVSVIQRFCSANLYGFASTILNDSDSNIQEPIRVCLRTNECIAIRITPTYYPPGSPVGWRVRFTMKGYSFGPLAGTLAGGPGFTSFIAPFELKKTYFEHPFPGDNDVAFSPRK